MAEGVVVGDDHLGLVQDGQIILRHQLARLIVSLRVGRLEHAQTVADGQAGRTDQKAVRELGRGAVIVCVDGLPGDDHRHHRRLTRTRRQLERQAVKFRVRIRVRLTQTRQKGLALPCAGRHLHQPNQRLDGLNLAKERPDVGKAKGAPMFQKPRRLRRYAPLTLRLPAPSIHLGADGIDQFILLIRDAVLLLLEEIIAIKPCPPPRTAGMGEQRLEGRRISLIAPVGRLSASVSQCRCGYAYGEFKMGLEKKSSMRNTPQCTMGRF